MKVTFLGSGGSSVSAKRACTSMILDDSTVFDLGPGSLKNLRTSRIPPDKISKVFISHQHADHISDLIPFLWAIQIDGRQAPLAVYGPPGFREILAELLKCTGTSDAFFKFPLSVEEIDFGTRLGEITTCKTLHSIPALAFRVDSNGRSFCYSADTTYCPAIIDLARNVDLLIHEATFLQDQASVADLTLHSTAEMAGRAGRESHAKRLALFHIPPPNESREHEFRLDASHAYGKEVIIGEDLASIEF